MSTASIEIRSTGYSLLLHVIVLLLLVINVQWFRSKPDNKMPPVIKAHVVLDEPVASPPKARTPVVDPQAAREAAARETARKHAAAKKAAEAKRIAAEKRRKAEVEKRRQAAEHRRQEEARQQMMQELEAEEQERQRAEGEARAAAAMSRFELLIRQKVTRNWIRPANAPRGLSCLVRVRLAAGGEVLSVTIVRSSGYPLFDRSVENAVFKSAPLPVPDDPELFQYIREININFDPED